MALLEVYLSARPGATRDADAALEARLLALLAAAEAALPEVNVPREEVARALGALEAEAEALGEDEVREVRLALGCARGDPAALRVFEADYLPAVDRGVAHMGLSADAVDELRQLVRDRLLVSDGGPPRVLGYAGRGTLRGLVKVIAVRTVISGLRKEKREVPGGASDLGDLADGALDPELTFLKAHYRAAFVTAFEGAVRSLEARERNILRLHLLGGMTLEQVAKMYGMGRATVVRAMAKARTHLFVETRRALRKDLAVEATELESILRLVQSRIEVSLGGLLASVDHDLPKD